MKALPIIILNLLLCSGLKAQEELNKGTGFGFQLNQYQNDFGLGMNITSPLFAGDNIGIRFRGNFMFNENVQDSATTWTPYSNVSLGIFGVSGKVGNRIRLYGEGGVMVIIPSSDISTQDYVIGGYGVFGFEFFMSHFNNYFIEIGGVGSGATADKFLNKPIYSNGLIVGTGFRFYLK